MDSQSSTRPPAGEDDGAALLRRARQRTHRVALGCGLGVAIAAAWCLMPVHAPQVNAPNLAQANDATPPSVEPLEVALFDAPVWTVADAVLAKAPPPPPVPPPPPPPLKVQLIGIIKEEQGYKAVLYDLDTNKVRLVSAGEDVQGRRVASVGADMVAIGEGVTLQTLLLKTTPGRTP